MEINFSHSSSKIKSFADAISNAIMHGELQEGDNLPSINEASAEYGISRDTVFKAYKILKKKGVVDSNPMKGYFVKGEVNHVLLLLDTYSSFKQNLYHRFAERLPENYKVELIFHQYNERLFDTIIRDSIGRYSMYVVMNFSNDQFSEALKLIPTGKLLLLDFGKFEKDEYSYICQDFNKAFYTCLSEAEMSLRKYRKLILMFPEEACHPVSAIESFIQFCTDYHFEYEIIRKESEWKGVERESAYLCIVCDDLVRVLKDAAFSRMEPGSDIGLIAYNNEAVFEVIKSGISTISIDFGLMGEMAAEYVLTKNPVQVYLPTELTLRGSL